MPRSPRERLIASAIELVRVHGVDGTGIADILQHSHTARGSIYQHFPGGKSELLAASTTTAAAWIQRLIREITTQVDMATAIEMTIDQIATTLAAEDFQAGCPIAAAAAATPDSQTVGKAAAHAFTSWTTEVAAALEREGRSEQDAASLAGFIVNSIEGALLNARCARSTEPLKHAAQQLRILLERSVGAS